MKHKIKMLSFAAIIAAVAFTANTNAADLEALPLELPKPSEQGTPSDIELSEYVETTDEYLELHRKPQWIQIDLEKPSTVSAILIWHSFATPQVYRDIVVLGSDDPEFKEGVTQFYNNDYDNTLGFGEGKDLEYFETHEGRLIDAKGKKVRYIRMYSNGSTFSRLNRYTEVEVWGLEE